MANSATSPGFRFHQQLPVRGDLVPHGNEFQLARLDLGCDITVGFGVHFSRQWLQYLGRLCARKWPVHFTEAFAIGAISDFVPWPAGANSDIRHHAQGISLKTFGSLGVTPRIALGAQAKCVEKWTPNGTLMSHLTSTSRCSSCIFLRRVSAFTTSCRCTL